MSKDIIFQIFSDAITLILTTSAPMLIAALIVGLIIAVFQATTQIQEQTLAFVPKIIVIFIVLLIAGPWIMDSLVNFTQDLFIKMSDFMMIQ